MADKKTFEQPTREIPKVFDVQEKNMDGSEKGSAPYKENRKIGSNK